MKYHFLLDILLNIYVYMCKIETITIHIEKKEENDLKEKDISSFKNSWGLEIELNDIQNN